MSREFDPVKVMPNKARTWLECGGTKHTTHIPGAYRPEIPQNIKRGLETVPAMAAAGVSISVSLATQNAQNNIESNMDMMLNTGVAAVGGAIGFFTEYRDRRFNPIQGLGKFTIGAAAGFIIADAGQFMLGDQTPTAFDRARLVLELTAAGAVAKPAIEFIKSTFDQKRTEKSYQDEEKQYERENYGPLMNYQQSKSKKRLARVDSVHYSNEAYKFLEKNGFNRKEIGKIMQRIDNGEDSREVLDEFLGNKYQKKEIPSRKSWFGKKPKSGDTQASEPEQEEEY